MNNIRTQDLTIRKATPDDFQTVAAIYREVGTWLHDVKGVTEQWDRELSTKVINRFIHTDELYLIFLDRQLVGAVRLTRVEDKLWTDREGDALYVHSLAVSRQFSGMEIGRRILEWIEDEARREGIAYVRLDAMAKNTRLSQYYVDAGFEALGQHPTFGWFALFEKAVDFGV